MQQTQAKQMAKYPQISVILCGKAIHNPNYFVKDKITLLDELFVWHVYINNR